MTSGVHFSVGSTFELYVVDESFNIDEQILGSDGTFTKTGISAADGDLVVIGNLRGDASQDSESTHLDINADTTGSNYPSQYLYGSNTSVASGTATDRLFGNVTGNTAVAGAFGTIIQQFTNFSDGSNDRTITTLSGYHADSGDSIVLTHQGRWNNTAAITSLKHQPNAGTNFLANSMRSVYAVPKNLITRTELASAAASVTFSSIPQTYDHLEVSWYANSDEDVTALRGVSTTFNGDTGTNYQAQVLEATGSSVSAATLTGQTDMPFAALTEGSSGAANEMSSGSFIVQNYTKTDRFKHLNAVYGVNQRRLHLGSNLWASTAAVTSIAITQDGSGDFIAGSVFTLRGIHSTVAAAATDIETINGIAAADIEAVN